MQRLERITGGVGLSLATGDGILRVQTGGLQAGILCVCVCVGAGASDKENQHLLK